ncbi:MAG: hypothetical protein DI537_13775 [Stutzerimonas stutzeri]|nr:MAG: hypothetical protein DI537_13775 [Stutzerimonas stutzeri]
MRKTTFAAIALVLAASTASNPVFAQMKRVRASAAEQARLVEAVKQHLKDPYSAVISDVRTYKTQMNIYACGLVNAKNSFGGYTGSVPFHAGSLSLPGQTFATPPIVLIGDAAQSNFARDCL